MWSAGGVPVPGAGSVSCGRVPVWGDGAARVPELGAQGGSRRGVRHVGGCLGVGGRSCVDVGNSRLKVLFGFV